MTDGIEKFHELIRYPYFSAVGRPNNHGWETAANWVHAVAECRSRKWENCKLMAGNALHWHVQTRAWDRTTVWNPLCSELRPKITSFVANLSTTSALTPEISEKIKDDISWDILSICLEYEYRDIVKPFFYLPYLDLAYKGGHLPCGWTGTKFPVHWDGVIRNGTLLVY